MVWYNTNMHRTCHRCKCQFEVKASTRRKKFCYKCLPVGQSAAKFLPNSNGKNFVCVVCNKEFIYEKNKYNNSTSACGVCLQRAHRDMIKKSAIKYLGGKCIKCGYNKCVDVLTFHHVDPNNKKHNISRMYGYSWESVKKELNKCILLCMNCHIELHASR